MCAMDVIPSSFIKLNEFWFIYQELTGIVGKFGVKESQSFATLDMYKV